MTKHNVAMKPTVDGLRAELLSVTGRSVPYAPDSVASFDDLSKVMPVMGFGHFPSVPVLSGFGFQILNRDVTP